MGVLTFLPLLQSGHATAWARTERSCLASIRDKIQRGLICTTTRWFGFRESSNITILGAEATRRVSSLAVNDIQIWMSQDACDYDDVVQSANYEGTAFYGRTYPLNYSNVKDLLRGRAGLDTDGREGLQSPENLIRAYLAVQDKRTISLPLKY
jgi:hypothetical protein